MALPLFAVTLFVSAFCLFLVQPIIGKMILPKLGGTPQVWNTCMVFFQTALLAGYGYTHSVSTRLPLRKQLMLHAAILFLPLALLGWYIVKWDGQPFPIFSWQPSNLGGNPIPDTLWLLLTVVGLPFIVLATSAPLLQKWFASTGHPAAKDPYFLYGASNLGSLLALLLYPVVVEPFLELNQQAWLFTIGYTILVGLALACAGLVWNLMPRTAPQLEPAPAVPPVPGETSAQAAQSTGVTATPPANPAQTGVKKGQPQRPGKQPGRPGATPSIHRLDDEVTGWRRLRWIGLAAVPTSFMLGVTTHITTDLSPIPLFWLVPLTLYLLSFILVYSRWPVLWVDQPHRVVLMVQPIALALMVFVEILGLSSSQIWVAVFFDVLAFFLTALACHGELAKDRPSTRNLTEYFLMMSVGGMLGGMFNGLLAPVLFIRVIEFNIAVFLACLLRPTLKEEGWTDKFVQNMLEPQTAHPQQHGKHHAKGHKPQQQPAQSGEGPTSYAGVLDFALPFAVLILNAVLVFVLGNFIAGIAASMSSGGAEGVSGMTLLLSFGIPLIICCFYYGRPIRFGLAVGAVLLIHSLYLGRHDSGLIYADRSYFGIIRVKKTDQEIIIGKEKHRFMYNQLIHGHINHGMNFHLPQKEDLGNPDKDFSRLATTYYHRFGPAGVVMEQYNWWGNESGPNKAPGLQNTYHADARLPTSVAGSVIGDLLGGSPIPASSFVSMWSEPPFATIGLGTGTMASYGRPFQHVHYYEIDNHIRRLSLPDPGSGGKVYFNYLEQAKNRGCEVQVLMGDARLRMALPYKNHYEDPATGGGPDNFYHMMVVDAFSSDAIPVHLITKQAFELYFKKLRPDGILCVHTSNRFVDLPKVIAAVSDNLGYAWQRGHDESPERDKGDVKDIGHYTSEWVMVARNYYVDEQGNFKDPKTDEEKNQLKMVLGMDTLRKLEKFTPRVQQRDPYWTTPTADRRYLWTDDHSNLISVLR